MEAEKFHDLSSATWRPRKFQSEFKGLRTRSTDVLSLSSRAGEDRHLSSAVRKRKFHLPPAFCPIRALNRLDDAHPL